MQCINKLYLSAYVTEVGWDGVGDTEVLKGHRVLWKSEIRYLIRMSSGLHNVVVTHSVRKSIGHLDEILPAVKSSG